MMVRRGVQTHCACRGFVLSKSNISLFEAEELAILGHWPHMPSCLSSTYIPVLPARGECKNTYPPDDQVSCLPLEFLNGWLFGVSASRVKPELKEKIIRYQRECYKILWQTFQYETSSIVDTHEVVQSASIVTLEQIREMGLAIAHMAEQQIEMEQRVNARLDRAAKVVGDIHRRLGLVERKLTPATLVTDAQAEEISGSVSGLLYVRVVNLSDHFLV